MTSALSIQSKSHSARVRGTPESPVVLHRRAASSQHVLQRKEGQCACGGGCPRCQSKYPLQAKREAGQPGGASAQNEGVADEAQNRTGIPSPLKAGLEALSGMNLSGLRVHENSSKPAHLNALAYTQGHEIHVGPGQEQYLPHEGWHAVQQMQGRVQPTMQAAGEPVNDDAHLEREADVMGAKALQTTSSGRDGLGTHALRPAAPFAAQGARPAVQIARQDKKEKTGIEPPLNIDVPQPGDTYRPATKYPWQNPELRATIYPYRDEMLSFFLQTYRELELLQDPTQVLEAGADEIRAERKALVARQTAVNHRLKDMLKRKVSKESMEWKQGQQEWTLLRDNLNYLPDPDEKKKRGAAPGFSQCKRTLGL